MTTNRHLPYKALLSAKEGIRTDEIHCDFKNAITGKVITKNLKGSLNQVKNWVTGQQSIQQAFPELSAEDRELFLTGMDGSEDIWNA